MGVCPPVIFSNNRTCGAMEINMIGILRLEKSLGAKCFAKGLCTLSLLFPNHNLYSNLYGESDPFLSVTFKWNY